MNDFMQECVATQVKDALGWLEKAKGSVDDAEGGDHSAFFEAFVGITKAEVALDNVLDTLRRAE